MGLMSKLFGKHETHEVAASEPAAMPSCPHTTLTPRWDRADDIGHEDRATGFRCEGCSTMFSPDEVRELRRSEGERLRETIPTG
jgi:hypothetical protein